MDSVGCTLGYLAICRGFKMLLTILQLLYLATHTGCAGHLIHGEFNAEQVPRIVYAKNDDIVTLESDIELSDSLVLCEKGSLLFDHRVVWTDMDEETTNYILLQNGEICSTKLEYDYPLPNHHVVLIQPMDDIVVLAFGILHAKQVSPYHISIRSFLKVKLSTKDKMAHYWKILLLYQVRPKRHLEVIYRYSDYRKETFLITIYPEPIKYNIPQLDTFSLIHSEPYTFEMSMTIFGFGASCSCENLESQNVLTIHLAEAYGYVCGCFHDDLALDITNKSKYNVTVVSSKDLLYIKLIIKNFTMHEFGKYYCHLNISHPFKQPQHLMTGIGMIEPPLQILNFYGSTYLKLRHMYYLYEDAMHDMDERFTSKMYNKSIFTLQQHGHAKARIEWVRPLTMTVSCFAILLIFVLLGCEVVKRNEENHRRKDLQQLKALMRNTSNRSIRNETTFEYDLYLSIDSQDRHFAEEFLLPELEKLNLNVCYGSRDLLHNRSQVQNSGYGIASSRRTIVVLSPAYCKNEWCTDFEFTAVFTGILDDDGPTDRLVVIKYKHCKVPDILMQHTYLDYTDINQRKTFIDRLVQSIGPPSDGLTQKRMCVPKVKKRHRTRKN